MRSVRHWTPRYVVNRIRLAVYERAHPSLPWLTPTANALIASLIRPTDRGLEWGSGRSTAWFAGRITHLTSVESDETWFGRVKQEIERRGLINVDYRLESLEPRERPADSPYVRVADRFEDRSLGLVLVDGDYREHCALAVVEKVAPGGLLVIDNSNWYLDRPTHSPDSRVGLGPLTRQWEEFERRVAGWRSIWTSSGVTDTAIWIRALD